MRVHRSYIVRLDRVSRLKRAGEAGVAELGDAGAVQHPDRARAITAQVKARIEALSRAARPGISCNGVIIADAFRARKPLVVRLLPAVGSAAR